MMRTASLLLLLGACGEVVLPISDAPGGDALTADAPPPPSDAAWAAPLTVVTEWMGPATFPNGCPEGGFVVVVSGGTPGAQVDYTLAIPNSTVSIDSGGTAYPVEGSAVLDATGGLQLDVGVSGTTANPLVLDATVVDIHARIRSSVDSVPVSFGPVCAFR